MASDASFEEFQRSSLTNLTWERHYKPLLKYLGLIILLIWTLFPIYYIFVNSLKVPSQVYSQPFGIPFVTFEPAPLDGNNAWTSMWYHFPFHAYLLATIVAALMTAVLATIAGIFAAYSFARLDFPLKSKLFIVTVAGFMIPESLLGIPIFVIILKYGMLNTYIGLTLAFTAFTLPYNIWLLRGFFEDLPRNLEESARIDGCTNFGAFRHVILPLSRPAIASVFLLAFLLAWHNYVMGFIISQDALHATVAVGIIRLTGMFIVENIHFVNAATFITVIVPVVLYMFLQKYLIKGLSASTGLKG